MAEPKDKSVLINGEPFRNLVLDVKLGDGKAEFLGEGTHEEFVQQERQDKGEDKWYKRILRDE